MEVLTWKWIHPCRAIIHHDWENKANNIKSKTLALVSSQNALRLAAARDTWGQKKWKKERGVKVLDNEKRHKSTGVWHVEL